METSTRRRKHWGWGYEDQQPPLDEVREARRRASARTSASSPARWSAPVPLEAVELPAAAARAARVARLDLLAASPTSAPRTPTASPTATSCAPSAAASTTRPTWWPTRRDEDDLRRLLDWCEEAGAAAIPYGGGTSVVGGVEPAVGDGYAARCRSTCGRLDRVLEVDPVSRAARIQAGAARARRSRTSCAAHGLTLRHFPQSFEFSTLGGWIATRAGGHFATLYTHIDDLVESVRALTPRGVWESRRLPGSGAGPSPDRLLLGSEGILGVITEAWVRVQARPTLPGVGGRALRRASSRARPPCARSRSPASTRRTAACSTPARPRSPGSAPDGKALLVLGFESADHPLDAVDGARARAAARDHGGEPAEPPRYRRAGEEGERGAGVDAWRNAFLQAPYLRDTLIAAGRARRDVRDRDHLGPLRRVRGRRWASRRAGRCTRSAARAA